MRDPAPQIGRRLFLHLWDSYCLCYLFPWHKKAWCVQLRVGQLDLGVSMATVCHCIRRQNRKALLPARATGLPVQQHPPMGFQVGPAIPTFHCTNPKVDGTCVYGPSLAPVDRPGEKITGVAAGSTTSLHELATLLSLTSQPCERWQELGLGRASLLYRRTQIMLEAARLLPAHRNYRMILS